MSWQQEIPFICSTLLHSYRILCAPTDMPCPLPTSPLPSPHHPLLVLYTHTEAHLALHMRRRFATFSAISAVFHVHVHVQDMKIFHSARFSLSLLLLLLCSRSRVYIHICTHGCVCVGVLRIQVGKLCTYIIIMEMVLT